MIAEVVGMVTIAIANTVAAVVADVIDVAVTAWQLVGVANLAAFVVAPVVSEVVGQL
jgi:hypothetical protein